MGNLDKFIKEWKVLESKMREQGIEVREWEEKHVGEIEAEQLKVCRIIRNYITHNPTDSFISRVDNTMIKWVKQFAKSLKVKKKSTLKKKDISKNIKKELKVNVRKQSTNNKNANKVKIKKRNSKASQQNINKKQPRKLLLKRAKNTKKRTK